MDISITDLFGNSALDNTTPFILINSSNIKKLLRPLDDNNDGYIYGYNRTVIAKELAKFDLSVMNFRFVCQIFVSKKDNVFPTCILLANSRISKPALKLMIVGKFNKGNIWMPIPAKGFGSLGVIYEYGSREPSLTNVFTIDSTYLLNKPYYYKSKTQGYYGGYASTNEFFSLTHKTHGSWTIWRAKVFGSSPSFYLRSADNKYVTQKINPDAYDQSVHDETGQWNELILRPYEYNKFQQISYSPEGELRLGNNTCVIVDDDNTVKLRNCDYDKLSNKQIWFPYKHTFVSQYNDKCLSVVNDNLTVSDCSAKESKNWIVRENGFVDPLDSAWKQHIGRSVFLVSSPNPWYTNSDMIDELTMHRTDVRGINEVPDTLDNGIANFETASNFALDRTIEGFGNNESSNDHYNMILICVIILVLLIILRRR